MKLKFILGSWSIVLLSVVAFAADGEMPTEEFFNMVLEAVKSFGGIPWTLKVASIITLIISSMKVSFLRPLWDKLGWIKYFSAGLLGLVAGILMLTKEGSFTFAGVFAYMFAGAGAVVLHQMLDGLKQIPGIGATFVSVIEFFQNILKAPKTLK